MELKLEVVLSSSIKRKKPWPRFCWLGLERESVFLLDDKRISEINMVSGRTKKKIPKLHPLLHRVVTIAASQNGLWLAGLMVSGELFLWSKDRDLLKTVPTVPEVSQLITVAQGLGTRLSLLVSGDGMRVLLVGLTGQVFLWECGDERDLTGMKDGSARGCWAHIQPPEDAALPSPQDKEASQHSIFVRTEAVGDVCLSALVFMPGEKLSVTFLKIQWDEGRASKVNTVGYSVRWVTKTYPLSRLTPACHRVKSRGALVPAFSPDGRLLAIVLNQRDPRATQVLFVSTQNFVSVTSGLGGCGSKKLAIPSKYLRSYWVGSVSWAPGGLYLACVLKRGSLLVLARLGGLLSLSTSGCNVDFGPAHFLSLHPLVIYRPPGQAGAGEASLSSSSASVRDILRQRFSVTWHPRLPYLIVSDGYMATVLRAAERPSPALLIQDLLQDTRQGLEKASCTLEHSQTGARAWLESVSNLRVTSSLLEQKPRNTGTSRPTPSASAPDTATSTLPLFLQDQGTMGDTGELLRRVQAMFDEDSDLDGPPLGSHAEDGGRLEFASMFDTLHALSDTQAGPGPSPDPDPDSTFDSIDPERKPPTVLPELRRVQASLLSAWALGVSLGGAVEDRQRLLRYALRLAVRFAALLRLLPNSGKTKDISFSFHLFNFLGTLLSFLPWDANHPRGQGCLGLTVDFSQQLVRLLLSPPPKFHNTDHSGQRSCQSTSHSLSTALRLLQVVSHCVDRTYSLQQISAWQPSHQQGVLSQGGHSQLHTDGYCVPLLQEGNLERPAQIQQRRPSSRLVGVWRGVYRFTQRSLEQLRGLGEGRGWEEDQEEEERQLSVLLSQIQGALQDAGGRLDDGPTLLSYPGEYHFLFGAYTESADAWRAELWAERGRDSGRSVFLETRLCLAQLYGLLFQYRLREAQGLGDHMARLLQHQAGAHQGNTGHTTGEGEWLPAGWLPCEVHREAACAVVQSLGRFMAAYFTNQPLYILPPHCVELLPPLHLPHAPSVGRLVPLCQQQVSGAVRSQQLSEVWTVGYAQDLLLLGALLPEAVWLAHCLGDWKTAASLGLAYTSYCSHHCDLARLQWRELHLPAALKPVSIFQAQLESLLGRWADSEETGCAEEDGHKSFTDSLEGEDMELLQASVQDILKASVMADVDVLAQPLGALLDSAKELSSCLPAMVPSGLYLPAPPLYCPQPAPDAQDSPSSVALGQLSEVWSRQKVSGVLQRVLLLLRASRCSRPSAQWYVSCLRRSRHRLHKIRQKYSKQPSTPREERALPESLARLDVGGAPFRQRPSGDASLDPGTIQTITVFRELCGLCWMLHVRDQFSLCCRKYQAARNQQRNTQERDTSKVRASCMEALQWACRMLPFSRFLNAEEVLQDTLLSLMSELTPGPLVAETLAQAFPEEEESVRVPLRDKYSSLQHRLRHCTVPASEQSGKEMEGEAGGEEPTMMILIRDRLRGRRKELRRRGKHLATPELHLWEKAEEEEEERRGHGAQWLGGTSLSTSTLTDGGRPLVYSDGDTADTSEALSPDLQNAHRKRGRLGDGADGKAARNVREQSESGAAPGQEEPPGQSAPKRPSPPAVGAWEFELEDEEYLRFLELLLSYVLEKDHADGGGCGGDPPLLRGFSSQLRDRELHSLAFDVLTTLRRRQRDGRQAARRLAGEGAPVFRAGHCYKPASEGAIEPPPLSAQREAPMAPASQPATPLPGLRAGKQQGLFGLKQQQQQQQQQQVSPPPEVRSKTSYLGSEPSPDQSSVPWEQHLKHWACGSLVLVEALEIQQELEPKLEAQFPGLGRLLEWMVRWADKRVLLGQPARKKEKETRGGGGVVIRVKSSAPAILTALSMLGDRYASSLLGTELHRGHLRVPERQWTVAPVLQPDVGWRLERDSSVDTGYPGSASTHITLPEQDPQQGEGSLEFQSERPNRMRSQETSHYCDPQEATFDLDRRTGVRRPSFDDRRDSVAEREDQTLSHKRLRSNIQDKALTMADLQNSDTERDTVTPKAPGTKSQTNLQLLPTAGLRSGASSASPTPGPRLQTTSTGPDQPLSSMARTTTTVTTTSVPGASSQPDLAQGDPVRQLFNDELFRLVQLQQINFMSLMQVVGASFANLPFPQQSTLSAQSNATASQPGFPAAATFPLPPNPFQANSRPPVPQAQAPEAVHSNPQSNQASTDLQQTVFQAPPLASPAPEPPPQGDIPIVQAPTSNSTSLNQPDTQEGARLTESQDMQPLSVHPEASGSLPGIGRRWIPSSQGPLSTVGPSQPTPSAPVILPSSSAASTSGLKLLQLHPPLLSLQRPQDSAPVREAWGPPPERLAPARPPHLNLSQYDQAAPRRTEVEDTGRERVSTAPPRHLNLGMYANAPFHDPAPRSTQPQYRDSGLGRIRVPGSPPLVLQAHRHPATPGLPLLRFHAETQAPITFPRLPVPAPSRLLTFPSAPTGSTPRLLLLQRDPDPRMIVPLAAPPARAPRLIPLEELDGWAAGRQSAGEARLQLLSVDPPARSPGQGSFDSLLTGQRLLDKAMATSAELHAFASTHKRPPESHDACTNTDPDMFLNLRFPKDAPVRDTETGQEPERNTDVDGRRFINVIDLEDDSLLRELPSRSDPAVPVVRPAPPSPPTSAQLHLLAASVVNAVQPELHASREDDPLPQPHTGVPEEHSRSEPRGYPVTVGLLQEGGDPSPGGGRWASSRPPMWQTTARLSEMDAQLEALQSIADHMESEFANTRLLVSTIETLAPAMVQRKAPLSKTVTLLVPTQERRRPHSSFARDADHPVGFGEDDHLKEEGHEEDEVASSSLRRHPSFLSPPSVEFQRSGLSSQHNPSSQWLSPVSSESERVRVWYLSQELKPKMAGSSRGWGEETLGLSGLSDMADIFGELMREGALSPSALGLSPAQAADLNRLDQPQGREGPGSARSEEERRELRIWMRRKQRERLVEYRRQREEKRELEHRPFSAPAGQKSTSKNLQAHKKTKAENDKRVFLEQYNQRAREACSLITDLLTTPLILPSSSSLTLTRPSSGSQQPLMAQPSGSVLSTSRGRSVSVGVKKQSSKSQLGRARSLSSTRTVSQRRPASRESLASKLGLHRPVSALPGDRLSRVTRRGMLTDLKTKTRQDTANKELRRERSQSPPGKGSSGATEQWESEEREVVSPWDPPPEIRKLLDMDDSYLGLGVPEPLEGQVGAARAGASGLDWLENLSGSTSSILSKLDWAAIESMVAGE
ncbi:ciliogenesis and planar polarity effector 1 [Aplochiton taeniatus]